MLVAAPGLSAAQGLLDLRNDYAFSSSAVGAVAERAYRSRLSALDAESTLDTDVPLLERLRRLVAGLLPAARFEHPRAASMRWEIHTCRRCDENASTMAGGKMLLGEEFIAALSPDDAELAYLLAHEMAHALAEHTREFATAARYFVDNGQARGFEDVQREIDQSIGVNLRMAEVYAQQELEADYIGFVLGARSGVEPDAMPRLLAKLGAGETSAFSLHPRAGERMRRAQAMLETARRIRAIGIRE